MILGREERGKMMALEHAALVDSELNGGDG